MFKKYEIAVVKYFKNLDIVPMPLLSWEVFGAHNHEITLYNAIQQNWTDKENYDEIVFNQKRDIIIVNKNQEIIFATNSIYKMTGYHPFEIIGNTPRMFQGRQTANSSKDSIREAISNNLPFKDIIVNYKKDGSTYLCEIEAYPKFNDKGDLVHYIAFEKIAS